MSPKEKNFNHMSDLLKFGTLIDRRMFKEDAFEGDLS